MPNYHTFFIYEDQFHKQLEGAPIGSPLIPVVYNDYGMNKTQNKRNEQIKHNPLMKWFKKECLNPNLQQKKTRKPQFQQDYCLN